MLYRVFLFIIIYLFIIYYYLLFIIIYLLFYSFQLQHMLPSSVFTSLMDNDIHSSSSLIDNESETNNAGGTTLIN